MNKRIYLWSWLVWVGLGLGIACSDGEPSGCADGSESCGPDAGEAFAGSAWENSGAGNGIPPVENRSNAGGEDSTSAEPEADSESSEPNQELRTGIEPDSAATESGEDAFEASDEDAGSADSDNSGEGTEEDGESDGATEDEEPEEEGGESDAASGGEEEGGEASEEGGGENGEAPGGEEGAEENLNRCRTRRKQRINSRHSNRISGPTKRDCRQWHRGNCGQYGVGILGASTHFTSLRTGHHRIRRALLLGGQRVRQCGAGVHGNGRARNRRGVRGSGMGTAERGVLSGYRRVRDFLQAG